MVVYDDRGNPIASAKQMALVAEPASYVASGSQANTFPSFVEGTESAPLVAFGEYTESVAVPAPASTNACGLFTTASFGDEDS